jgi:hypothetical protein
MGALLLPILLAVTAPPSAPNTSFEAGLQVGAADRRLGNTAFHTAFNAQLYADVTLLPRLLAVGAYWNGMPTGGRAPPDRLSAGDVDIVTLGVRAKLFWPREGVRPYVSAGIGRASAAFPETRRFDQVVAASTQRFVEVPLAAGVTVPLEGPFVMTVEGAYRLGLGYRNDAYDRLLHGSSSPSAHAWTLHFGLAVAL